MILGKPTMQSILDYLQAEDCPFCEEYSTEIQVNGVSEVILECGHVVDATRWIDDTTRDAHLTEFEENPGEG